MLFDIMQRWQCHKMQTAPLAVIASHAAFSPGMQRN